jgi:hypothetical protein
MLLPIRKGPKLAIAYARSHQRLQWLPEDPGQVPEFAEAVAADFEQRPRAQATLSPGRKYDAPRLESASDLPGRQRVRAPPLHLEIVDCPPADEAADASVATDQPSKARAERHWVADIAALAISGRALKNACGDTPIAKTLDCDLGLVARDLANLRATGHASGDLETQCLGGRLRIRRDRNIDEISHLDLPVSMLSANSARMGGGRNAARHPA